MKMKGEKDERWIEEAGNVCQVRATVGPAGAL